MMGAILAACALHAVLDDEHARNLAAIATAERRGVTLPHLVRA